MKNTLELLVKEYGRGLKKGSRFYAQDLQDFRDSVAKLPENELQTRLRRLQALNSPEFARFVRGEVDKMGNAGMFNPAKMGAKNACD